MRLIKMILMLTGSIFGRRVAPSPKRARYFHELMPNPDGTSFTVRRRHLPGKANRRTSFALPARRAKGAAAAEANQAPPARPA